MDIYIARQPIYDKELKVAAYELLYRSKLGESAYSAADGDVSTASVILGAFLDGGFESMTDNKPGFVNFTDSLLKSEAVTMLPAKRLVIEILETVEPTQEVLAACEKLAELGFSMALDDYVLTDSTEGFIQFAKIIKMDFLNSTDDQLKNIVRSYKGKNISFLAEKIETKEDFLKAKSYGYTFFQGYYFSRPTLVENKVLLPLQINAMQVLEMLHDDNCDVQKMAKIIDYDPGMRFKLLRLANSVGYGALHKTNQTGTAIARIGLTELRTWMLFVLMHGSNMEKPNELIKQSMVRAIAAEEICIRKKLDTDSSGFSLLGLFSLLDAIMDAPFDVILSSINIDDRIKATLVNPGDKGSVYDTVFQFIHAYDNADWKEAESIGSKIGLTLDEYGDIYLNSIILCDEMYNRYKITV